MNSAFAIINGVLGLALRLQRDIKVGAGSSVGWWNLNARGGTLRIGAGCMLRCRVDFDNTAGRIIIGDRCFIGASHLVCHSRISIDSDVIISWGVTIVDHDSHSLDWSKRQLDVQRWLKGSKSWDDVEVAPVHINERAWVGFGASILKGVTVGAGAVVGACAVVTRDVPPYTIVAGNPARVVRELPQSKNANLL